MRHLLYILLILSSLVTQGQNTYIFPTLNPGSPTTNNDGLPITSGIKFRSSINGYIVSLRFYKTTGNNGTHIGALYNGTGTLLEQVTYTGETATGWQEVALPTPISITSGATYVTTVSSTVGNYLSTLNGLTSAITNSNLTALANGTDGTNGVYIYSATTFPTSSYSSSNYWTDVGFNTTVAPIANAGPDQNITLPTSSVTLTAAASTGTITSYAWTKVSGPNTPTITSPTTVTTSVTGLIAGTYIFQIALNPGAVSTDQVTVVVNPAGSLISITTTIIPTSSTDLLSSGRAAEYWNNTTWTNTSGGGVYIPSGKDGTTTSNTSTYNYYRRFNWVDIESTTTQNSYDWTAFDVAIHHAIDSGQLFSFSVMPMCSACGLPGYGYPTYLHNLMQAESVNSRDWHYTAGGNDIWVPNWNSPNFLGRYKALLQAFATHIASTSYNGHNYADVILYADIRGFGDFGEWHTYPWYGTEPTGRTATVATWDSLIQFNKEVFPNIKPMIPEGAFDNGDASLIDPASSYFALTQSNNTGLIGWRRDNWGDPNGDNILVNNAGSYNPGTGSVAFAPLIMNRYKTSMVGGEPDATPATVTPGGTGTNYYYDFLREVNLYHPATFGNGNLAGVNDSTRAHVIASSKASGYRIQPTGGTITGLIAPGGPFNLTVNWQNVGLTPVYNTWNTVFQIRNGGGTVVWSGTSAFQAKLFLPSGSPTATIDNFTLTTIPFGTYSLYVGLIDPIGYSSPLTLAINNRGSDGYYLLSNSIQVGNPTVDCQCIIHHRGINLKPQ